jgi:glutamate 5-kinase
MEARQALKQRARTARIVIKIGSGVLTDSKGRLEPRTVKRLAQEIAPLAGARRWPLVVSSGAIAVGVSQLGLPRRPKTMPGLQAAAAVGQSKLVEAWGNAFRRFELPVGQVLLTHSDLADRRRFLNTRRALLELERRRAIAVINENDTVSFEEIAFGDNDGLAAQVSNVVDADILILLSVAPGLLDESGTAIDHAPAADPHLDELVRPDRSKFGTGGMRSKLKAARIAASRGAHVAIVPGREPGMIAALLDGAKVGTLLTPELGLGRLSSRDHWIAHTLRPVGTLVVDDGAVRALRELKKSLLPSGILEVIGRFEDGEPVDIARRTGAGTAVFARGLSQYAAEQLRRIAGQPSSAIAERLGFTVGDAAVHRDDMVVFTAETVPSGAAEPALDVGSAPPGASGGFS